MSFDDFTKDWMQFPAILKDRGSKYTVTVAVVHSREEIAEVMQELLKNKSFRKATHNTYAARYEEGELLREVKNDDGETGAGNVILQVMQGQDVKNILVIVTRWFGGTKLYGDRFKRVKEATQMGLERFFAEIKDE